MGNSAAMHGRVNAAGVLAVIGAGALLAGLFLDWFEPGISAWSAFEIVDLLLATIAAGVLVVALAASSDRPRLVALAGWLPVGAIAALVLVVVSLINPPPAAAERSLEIGAWVSLAGAALLVVGAILATTELSLVITVRPRRRGRAAPAEEVAPPTSDPDWEPPFEQPLAEEPPFDEPLEEPPLDEPPLAEPPLEEPPTGEELVEPGEEPEPDDEVAGPTDEDDEASAETQALRPPRRDDQGSG